MKVALWIALRHLWRGRNRYARLINWMTLAGLCVGVLVLTVVVSVMNGFDAELRGRILGTVPHVLLPRSEGLDARAVAQLPGVAAAHPFLEASGMVIGAGGVAPVAVYGIDAGDAGLLATIDAGTLGGTLSEALAAPTGLVMGGPLARRLGLVVGDHLRLALPQADGEGCSRASRPFGLRGCSRSARNSITAW